MPANTGFRDFLASTTQPDSLFCKEERAQCEARTHDRHNVKYLWRFMNLARFMNLWRIMNSWRFMNFWRFTNHWRFDSRFESLIAEDSYQWISTKDSWNLTLYICCTLCFFHANAQVEPIILLLYLCCSSFTNSRFTNCILNSFTNSD